MASYASTELRSSPNAAGCVFELLWCYANLFVPNTGTERVAGSVQQMQEARWKKNKVVILKTDGSRERQAVKHINTMLMVAGTAFFI